MNKLTRKLLISVFTLVFAAITLGATTFAWFTLANRVTLADIDLDVASGYGIEISLDGETYKNKITLADLKEFFGLEEGDSIFETLTALTSPNGYDFYTFDGLFADEPQTTSEGFFEFNLYFRSTTKNAKVFLDNNTKTYSEAKVWTSDANFTYKTLGEEGLKNLEVEVGNPINVYAANSLRLSFQEMVLDEEGKWTAKKDEEENLFVTIWELDRSLLEGQTDTFNFRLDSSVKTEGLLSYWADKNGGEDLINKYNALDEDLQLPTNVKNNEDLNNENGIILTIDQTVDGDTVYIYGYLTIRFWLEGWDPDNFDAIFESQLKVSLSFSVTEAE